ncbi:hypothetical protein BASA81_008575 [Batrachochytrium salamandrivorans]|nr:hypothetical protein BASA81_008575 [Batrachochytrium salamandrivorans]
MSFVLCPHDDSGKCLCRSLGLGKLSIWTAAEFGLVDDVALELRKHSNAIKCDGFGYTALHYAAQRNHIKVVELLLKTNSAIVDYNECGATALHRAAGFGSVQACEMLLNAGADANRIDTSFADGRTSLMKACALGHLAVVQLLLEDKHKVDQQVRDGLGKTAWDLADEYPEIQSLLNKPTTTALASLVVAPLPSPPPLLPPSPPPSLPPSPTPFISCDICHQPALFLQRQGDDRRLVCAKCKA